MADSKLSNEQLAHDLAVALCAKSISSDNIPSEDADIDGFVQDYLALYERVLKSVNHQR